MCECCDQLSAHCQLQGLALHTSCAARPESVRRLAGSGSLPSFKQSGQVTSQSSLGAPWVPSLVTMEAISWVVSNSRNRWWGLAVPWAVPAMALPGSSVGSAPVSGVVPCPPHPLCLVLSISASPQTPQACAVSVQGCQVAVAVSDVSGHARPEGSLGNTSRCPWSSVAAGHPSGLVLLPVSVALAHLTCFSSFCPWYLCWISQNP